MVRVPGQSSHEIGLLAALTGTWRGDLDAVACTNRGISLLAAIHEALLNATDDWRICVRNEKNTQDTRTHAVPLAGSSAIAEYAGILTEP